TRYLYPTQRGRLNRLTYLLGVAWAALLAAVLAALARGEGAAARRLALASLYFPVYYMAASWAVSLRIWRRRQARREAGAAPPGAGGRAARPGGRAARRSARRRLGGVALDLAGAVDAVAGVGHRVEPLLADRLAAALAAAEGPPLHPVQGGADLLQ